MINLLGTLNNKMSGKTNRGVVYLGPNKVEVREIPYPKLQLDEQNRKCEHGVILKVCQWEGCCKLRGMLHG